MLKEENKTIKWINACFEESRDHKSALLSWKSDYKAIYPKDFLDQTDVHSETLIRDGLFNIFWHIYNHQKLPDGCILPIEAARFLKADPSQVFYKIQRISQEAVKSECLLIGLCADPNVMPLTLWEAGLENLVSEINSFKAENVYFHLSLPSSSILGSSGFQSYLYKCYKIFTDKMGFLPTILSDVDMKRMADMSKWSFYLPEYHWVVGDNYLEHFCLSKNASAIKETKKDLQLTSMIRSAPLSPFHQMVFGFAESGEKNLFLEERFQSFKKLAGLSHNLPYDFMNLIYENGDYESRV